MPLSPAGPTDTTGLKRFFTAFPAPLEHFPQAHTVTDEILLHHLRTVVRAAPGDAVVLVDPLRELAYSARIERLQKQEAQFTCLALLECPPCRLPYATLAMALLKEQAWDLVLQKATELGVRAIQPLLAGRGVVKLSARDIPRKVDRWQMIARGAAQQSEGLFIPQVLAPLSVEAFCQGNTPGNFRVLLSERGANRVALKALLPDLAPGQAVVLAVGPEGGWAEAEHNHFVAAGFVPASLGERILRAETAAIAALSALTYEFSEPGG